MKRWPHIATFVLFIALCMSAAYWAMQLPRPPLRPVAAPPTVQYAPRLDAAAALFGGRPAIAIAGNLQLKGVVASNNMAESVAILAVDGKPARAVKVDGEAAPGVKVMEVQPRYVLLSEKGGVKRVDLPEGAKGGAKIGIPAPARRKNEPAQRLEP